MQISKNDSPIIARSQQIVGAGREPDAPHVAGVRRKTLQGARPAHVVERARAVVVATHQQAAAGVYC